MSDSRRRALDLTKASTQLTSACTPTGVACARHNTTRADAYTPHRLRASTRRLPPLQVTPRAARLRMPALWADGRSFAGGGSYAHKTDAPFTAASQSLRCAAHVASRTCSRSSKPSQRSELSSSSISAAISPARRAHAAQPTATGTLERPRTDCGGLVQRVVPRGAANGEPEVAVAEGQQRVLEHPNQLRGIGRRAHAIRRLVPKPSLHHPLCGRGHCGHRQGTASAHLPIFCAPCLRTSSGWRMHHRRMCRSLRSSAASR